MKQFFNRSLLLLLLFIPAIIGLQSCHDDDDDTYNPLIGTVWKHEFHPAEDETYSYNGVEASARIAYFSEKYLEEYALDMNGKIIDRMNRYPYEYKKGHLYVGEKDWRHEVQWDHYFLNLLGGMTRCNSEFRDFL